MTQYQRSDLVGPSSTRNRQRSSAHWCVYQEKWTPNEKIALALLASISSSVLAQDDRIEVVYSARVRDPIGSNSLRVYILRDTSNDREYLVIPLTGIVELGERR